MWRSNAVMYVTVPYNKVLFSILYFLTIQSEFDFGIAHVQVNEKQWKFMVLTSRLKLLIEKTKRFKRCYFNTRKRKKKYYIIWGHLFYLFIILLLRHCNGCSNGTQ
jgi:hypothetical protein